jgi:hypothetical protein
MRTNCRIPSIPPYPYALNCEQIFVRQCNDGSGSVSGIVPAAYFAVLIADYSSEAAAQIAANEMAYRLARRLALQQILSCNTITPDDVAGCGCAEERPNFSPACALVLCTPAGFTICTEDGLNLEVTT